MSGNRVSAIRDLSRRQTQRPESLASPAPTVGPKRPIADSRRRGPPLRWQVASASAGVPGSRVRPLRDLSRRQTARSQIGRIATALSALAQRGLPFPSLGQPPELPFGRGPCVRPPDRIRFARELFAEPTPARRDVLYRA